MKKIIVFFLSIFLFLQTQAQSEKATAYILKGGLSAGSQKWDNSFDRQLLLKYHGAIAVESANTESKKYALYAQLGYHVRGSATRFRYLFQGGGINTFKQNFEFYNISLILGAKQKTAITEKLRYFYFAGLRGDYNIGTNLKELTQGNPYSVTFYPVDAYVNKWVGGVSLGGGLEFDFGDLTGSTLELSVNPDFTYQYNSPPIFNVSDPLNPGQQRTIQQRQIRNVTIELSLGIKLVRKVVYDL